MITVLFTEGPPHVFDRGEPPGERSAGAQDRLVFDVQSLLAILRSVYADPPADAHAGASLPPHHGQHRRLACYPQKGNPMKRHLISPKGSIHARALFCFFGLACAALAVVKASSASGGYIVLDADPDINALTFKAHGNTYARRNPATSFTAYRTAVVGGQVTEGARLNAAVLSGRTYMDAVTPWMTILTTVTLPGQVGTSVSALSNTGPATSSTRYGTAAGGQTAKAQSAQTRTYIDTSAQSKNDTNTVNSDGYMVIHHSPMLTPATCIPAMVAPNLCQGGPGPLPQPTRS